MSTLSGGSPVRRQHGGRDCFAPEGGPVPAVSLAQKRASGFGSLAVGYPFGARAAAPSGCCGTEECASLSVRNRLHLRHGARTIGRLIAPGAEAVSAHAAALLAVAAVAELGQRLGSAARGRRSERVQRSHRRLLQGAPAAAPGDGQCAHPPNRQHAQPEGSPAMALARPRGQAGRWHRTVHA